MLEQKEAEGSRRQKWRSRRKQSRAEFCGRFGGSLFRNYNYNNPFLLKTVGNSWINPLVQK